MTALLLEWLAKSFVVLGLGLFARHIWRRPATRHLTLATALGAALLLPIAIGLLPAWSLPGWQPRTDQAAGPQSLATPLPGEPVVGAGPVPAPSFAAVAAAERTSLSLPSPKVAWLAGALLVLSVSAIGRLRRWHLVRGAATLSRGRSARLVRSVAAELGIRREVRLLAAPGDVMPATWGWLRPRVLLPISAVDWSPTRLRAVLRHELAHVARGDALFRGLSELSCALLWAQPLAWLAARRLRLDQELACDAMVVAAGTDPHEYAGELLALVREQRARRLAPAALAMARPSSIERRLHALLHPLAGNGSMTRTRTTAALVALAALTLPLAALSPTRAAQQRHRADAAQEPSTASARAQSNGSTITWVAEDMEVSVRRTGELQQGSSLEDLRLSPGGSLDIRGLRGGAAGAAAEELRFEARSDAEGRVTLRWLVNGDERPLDDEGRAWATEAIARLQDYERHRDVEIATREHQRELEARHAARQQTEAELELARQHELQQRHQALQRAEAEVELARQQELQEQHEALQRAELELEHASREQLEARQRAEAELQLVARQQQQSLQRAEAELELAAREQQQLLEQAEQQLQQEALALELERRTLELRARLAQTEAELERAQGTARAALKEEVEALGLELERLQAEQASDEQRIVSRIVARPRWRYVTRTTVNDRGEVVQPGPRSDTLRLANALLLGSGADGPGWQWFGSHSPAGDRLTVAYRGEIQWGTLEQLELADDAELRLVQQRADGGIRALTVLPSATGSRHVWSVDGEERPLDAEARAWIDAVLTGPPTRR